MVRKRPWFDGSYGGGDEKKSGDEEKKDSNGAIVGPSLTKFGKADRPTVEEWSCRVAILYYVIYSLQCFAKTSIQKEHYQI